MKKVKEEASDSKEEGLRDYFSKPLFIMLMISLVLLLAISIINDVVAEEEGTRAGNVVDIVEVGTAAPDDKPNWVKVKLNAASDYFKAKWKTADEEVESNSKDAETEAVKSISIEEDASEAPSPAITVEELTVVPVAEPVAVEVDDFAVKKRLTLSKK